MPSIPGSRREPGIDLFWGHAQRDAPRAAGLRKLRDSPARKTILTMAGEDRQVAFARLRSFQL